MSEDELIIKQMNKIGEQAKLIKQLTNPTFKLLPPQQGGCWYCNMEGARMYMCREFDTWVHAVCVARALKKNPNDEEAQIIARDIGVTLEK